MSEQKPEENTSRHPDPTARHENDHENGSATRARDVEASAAVVQQQAPPTQPAEKDYSVFTSGEKKLIVLCGSIAAFFSPLSSMIYFPALNTIANDLQVTTTQINLSVTTYLILQGIAPMMIAGFSDSAGRRPAYIVCLIIYIAANLGLALQNSYAALVVLRCVQSAGSSGTVALANGLTGDIVTSAERGQYIAYSSVAAMLGPSISPVIGGLISQYLGWKWIFWFLLIFALAVFLPMLLFLPETCRKVVGDGSVPPPRLNQSLLDVWWKRSGRAARRPVDPIEVERLRKNYKLRFPNPLSTLVVIGDKESGLLLLATGLGFTNFYALSTAAASQFPADYGFNDAQVALMFVPIGVGGMIAAVTIGRVVDWNYARWCRRLEIPVVKNRQLDLADFPIERARLEIALPLFCLASASVLVYGWTTDFRLSVAAPVVAFFVFGYTQIGAFQALSILMVDIYPGKPATATAANNLVRCELGAAASAIIEPMIRGIGQGWTFTIAALLFLAYLPVLWLIMQRGPEWRKQRLERKRRKAEKAGKTGKAGKTEIAKQRGQTPALAGTRVESGGMAQDQSEKGDGENSSSPLELKKSEDDPRSKVRPAKEGSDTLEDPASSEKSARRSSDQEKELKD